MTDFTVSALQSPQRRTDADSENGRDLSQGISLNFFQEKHVAVSLGQFEGSQDRTLEGAGSLQSRRRSAGV
jgi:hypothetical protein